MKTETNDVLAADECVTLTATRRRGGGKPFVCRIVGTHPQYRFAREFLPDRYEAFEPGLYQTRHTDSNMRRDKAYHTDSYLHIDDQRRWRWVSESEAYEIAKAIGGAA